MLSYLARNEAMVTAAFTGWLHAGNGIVISRVTAYEFRRGVYAGSVKPAEAHAGELFLVNFAVIEVDEDAWDRARLVAHARSVPSCQKLCQERRKTRSAGSSSATERMPCARRSRRC